MNINQIYTDISGRIGSLKSTPKGWLMRDCMLCHRYGESQDKRKRFGIRFDSGSIQSHCFNCGHKSKFDGTNYVSKDFRILLEELGFDEKYIKTINFNIFQNHENQKPLLNTEKPCPTKKWTDFKFDVDPESIKMHLERGENSQELINICQYLMDRKINPLDFYWNSRGGWQFKNRALMKFFYEDKLVGFTARYAGNPPNKKTPRYFSHVPEDFIYGYRKNISTSNIIVTEGVLDAYHVKGMAVFGNTISTNQKQLLDIHKDKVIILPDFSKDGYSLVESALNSGYRVSIPKWYKTYKDAAEAIVNIGRIATVKYILDGVTDDKLKINVMWGLLNK